MEKRPVSLPMCPVVNASGQCTINLLYPRQKAGSHMETLRVINCYSHSSEVNALMSGMKAAPEVPWPAVVPSCGRMGPEKHEI